MRRLDCLSLEAMLDLSWRSALLLLRIVFAGTLRRNTSKDRIVETDDYTKIRFKLDSVRIKQ